MNWIILILISAVFVSFKDIISKEILEHNHTLPFIFMLTTSAAVGMLIFYQKLIFDLSLQVYGLLIIKSLVLALAWMLMYKAIKHMEISVVMPLSNFSPIILLILSYLFLGEVVGYINFVGIVLIIVAGYFLEIDTMDKFKHPFKAFKNKYFIYIAAGLVLLSISATLDKFIIKFVNPHTFLFFMYFFMSLIYLTYLTISKKLDDIKYLWKNSKQWLALLIPIVIIADLTYFLAVAIPEALISLIIPLKRTSTLFTVVIGGNIFHEKHLLHKAIICIIMIFGVFLVIM